MVIVGGGPGGYEAALVAAQLGAEVTLVDSDGLGGSAVLTDCVPSKTLITVADVMDEVFDSRALGVRFPGEIEVALDVVNERVRRLAAAQSRDVGQPPAGRRSAGRSQDGDDLTVPDGSWRPGQTVPLRPWTLTRY